MKLGYVVKEFPRLSETFILTELLGLEAAGCELTVLSRYRPTQDVPHAALAALRAEPVYLEDLLQERFWEPFEIHRRLGRRHGHAHDRALECALAYRSRQELRYWMLAGRVAEVAVERGLDLLHAHFATGSASVARYASLITGIPFTFTAHAKDIYASSVNRARLRDLLGAAATVITVSDANVDFLRSVAPEANVVRVYNGLSLDRFPFLPSAPSGSPPLILSVARLVEKKGLHDLVDAVAGLRAVGIPARLKLVGTGPEEQRLRERILAHALGHAVEFRGSASQEEVVSRHLPEASVYALPCVLAADGDRDGLPTTLLEAMARGVPVVSTTLPGVPEALPHGEAGLLAEPGDVPGLTEAIRLTLTDRVAAESRRRRARRRVEQLFDSRCNVRLLLNEFRAAQQVPARAEAG